MKANEGAQGHPQQQSTYLTPGEQWGDAADGPQGQVQVLHHRGCVERGANDQGTQLYASSRGPLGTYQLGALFALLGGVFTLQKCSVFGFL